MQAVEGGRVGAIGHRFGAARARPALVLPSQSSNSPSTLLRRASAQLFPDPLEEFRYRFGWRGTLEGLGEAFRNLPREAFTDAVTWFARNSIERSLADPRIGRAAREVLERMLSGRNDRHSEYNMDDPNTRYRVQELFRHAPREYYLEEVKGIIRYLLNETGRTYVRNGDVITNHTYQEFHEARIGPLPAAVIGFSDGPQIGDVVGTMSSGWTLEVRNDRMFFSARNSTNLESFMIGNALPMVGQQVILPLSGQPMSTVTQTYRFSMPIPPALTEPRRGR